MSDKPQDSAQSPRRRAALRKRAEEQVRITNATSHPVQTPEKIQQMLHELQVHQIELEMQNEELRASQEVIEAVQARYFDLYDLAPVGYCTLSEQGLILEANLTAASLLGTTRSALVKQSISRFILKEDRGIYYRLYEKLSASGDAQVCELRLAKPDGAFIWGHLTVTVAQAEDGAPVVRMAFSDITDQKRAEEALKKSRHFLESTLNGLSANIVVVDNVGEIILTNSAYRDFAECNGIASALVSETVNYLAVIESAQGADSDYARAFARGLRDVLAGRCSYFELEYPCHSPDEQRWFVARVTLLAGEGPRLAVIAHENISERKRGENALMDQAQHSLAILNTVAECILTIDKNGVIQSHNPGTSRIFGYGNDDLSGQNVSILMPTPHREAHDDYLRAYQDTGVSSIIGISREVQGQRKDGSLFPLELSVSEISQNGQPIFVGVMRDISQQKAAMREICEARDEAERANIAKSEFLSRMSHELRTPLNAILGFTQVLQLPGEQPLSTRQVDHVHEIQYAGEHLLGLINEVLDLARIESGHLEVNLEPLALIPEIEHCAAQITPAAAQRAITIKLPSTRDYTVMADPTRLHQVLLNLLSNAVKYNREGGRIEVECTPAAEQRVRVSLHDSGLGLSVEQIARLFRPFERLQSAYEGIEGTGIGLALAKQLVVGMQGSIGVDSVPGEGSSFWFELPLCEAAAMDIPRETPVSASTVTSAPRGKLHRVLYIEDNPANLRLVQKTLERRADIELLSAENAEDGLVLAGQEHPDLILLDINLPGMDGFDALQCLRADPATRAIPVIAVSANAMERDIERGRVAGFQDYLVKPINIRDLFTAIDTGLATPKGTP